MPAPTSQPAINLAAVAHRPLATRVRGGSPQPQKSTGAFLRALDIASRRPTAQSMQTMQWTAARQGPIRAVRQSDPREYESAAQAKTWGGSTCSAASLTAVLRSRGIPVKIADVMRAMPGGMTPELGLVSRPSLVSAARQFGLAASDDVQGYDAFQRATASGQPVLVDIRNSRFPQGHWIVVTASHANGVEVVDSSGYDTKSISRSEFLASWSGKGIRVGA